MFRMLRNEAKENAVLYEPPPAPQQESEQSDSELVLCNNSLVEEYQLPFMDNYKD